MIAEPTLAPTSRIRAEPRSKMPARTTATAKAPATVDDWVMAASTRPSASKTATPWCMAKRPWSTSQTRSGSLATFSISMPRNSMPTPRSTSTPWRSRSVSLKSK